MRKPEETHRWPWMLVVMCFIMGHNWEYPRCQRCGKLWHSEPCIYSG